MTKKTTKKAVAKKQEIEEIEETDAIEDENIDEQTAEFVEVIHSICKLPHHKDTGEVDWDMVNDCVDILAQRKPGIENLESHDQHAICQHLCHHFKESGKPVPDQIAALA